MAGGTRTNLLHQQRRQKDSDDNQKRPMGEHLHAPVYRLQTAEMECEADQTKIFWVANKFDRSKDRLVHGDV
jgi:hypothetical protein